MEVEDEGAETKGVPFGLDKIKPLKSLLSSKKIPTKEIYYKASQVKWC
jgi:hypothetical protein